MWVIVDANIILAMLIKPGKPIDLFFNSKLTTFAPQLLFEELENNRKSILKKSKIEEEDFDWLLHILKANIRIIAEKEFLDHREQAIAICPDPKDVVYFALALHLQCPIWTNEKKLAQQDDIEVYATHELMKLFAMS